MPFVAKPCPQCTGLKTSIIWVRMVASLFLNHASHADHIGDNRWWVLYSRWSIGEGSRSIPIKAYLIWDHAVSARCCFYFGFFVYSQRLSLDLVPVISNPFLPMFLWSIRPNNSLVLSNRHFYHAHFQTKEHGSESVKSTSKFIACIYAFTSQLTKPFQLVELASVKLVSPASTATHPFHLHPLRSKYPLPRSLACYHHLASYSLKNMKLMLLSPWCNYDTILGDGILTFFSPHVSCIYPDPLFIISLSIHHYPLLLYKPIKPSSSIHRRLLFTNAFTTTTLFVTSPTYYFFPPNLRNDDAL